MKHVTFDIETIPCQLPGIREEFAAAVQAPGTHKKPETIAAWMAENREAVAEAEWLKTSFDGGLGQCVVIGWAVDDGPAHAYAVEDLSHDAERQVLEDFFSALTDIGYCKFIGHNVIGFDIPFLWKRAMVLGVKPPANFPRSPKPWGELVTDTMLLWDSQQRAGGSMDRICKLMGIPGKGDVSGADVWPLVQAGQLGKVAAYCKGDVERTRAMFKRMTFADDAPAAVSAAWDAQPATLQPKAAAIEPAPAAPTHAEFVALVMEAFAGRFPTQPRMSVDWWASVRAMGEALQAVEAA